jgi:hypothetical protein
LGIDFKTAAHFIFDKEIEFENHELRSECKAGEFSSRFFSFLEALINLSSIGNMKEVNEWRKQNNMPKQPEIRRIKEGEPNKPFLIDEKKADIIIETRKPIGKYYVLENGVYVGIDNSTGDAWVEEFTTEKQCLEWLNLYD